MSDTQEIKEITPKKNKNIGKKNNLIVIFLSVILAILLVLFFIQRNENSSVINAINAEKDSLNIELSKMSQHYDSLKTDNDTINQQLFLAQTQVKDLITEIKQVKKASYSQISDYQKKVGSLRQIMMNYVVQVDSLNRKNKFLMEENRKVKQNYMEMESRNKALEKDKKKLSQKIEKAAMLEALDLHVEGINKRGKDVSTKRKAEQLKISFTLSKNVTSKRGNKKLYIRILRPDQILLVKSNDNLFKFENLRIPYSAMREVTYEGNELPINIFWDNTGESPFMDGIYTIDVFTDGNNIGTASFAFKK